MNDKKSLEVKSILEKEKCCRVEFGPGLLYTPPDQKAGISIAHSRGMGRLQYSSKRLKTFSK
jgi:hypothetical protein